jgi:hypothetical protein
MAADLRRRLVGGCSRLPDKEEVSGSSPLRPIRSSSLVSSVSLAPGGLRRGAPPAARLRHHPDTLQRRFLHTGGIVLNRGNEIVVWLDRRAYSPVLRQADLPTVTVPWWGDRQLRYEFA